MNPVCNFDYDFDIPKLLKAYRDIEEHKYKRPNKHNAWRLDVRGIEHPSATYILNEFKRLEKDLDTPIQAIKTVSYDNDGFMDWHIDKAGHIGCRIHVLLTGEGSIEFEEGKYSYHIAAVDVHNRPHKYDNLGKAEKIVLKGSLLHITFEEACERIVTLL